MNAQSINESRRRRVEATRAEVDAVLEKSARYRKRQANPLWIAVPVLSGAAFTAGVAYLAHLLV